MSRGISWMSCVGARLSRGFRCCAGLEVTSPPIPESHAGQELWVFAERSAPSVFHLEFPFALPA